MARLKGSFIDPTDLTNLIKYLIYMQIIIDIIASFSAAFQFQLIMEIKHEHYLTLEQYYATGKLNDQRQQIIMGFQFINNLILCFFYFAWLYRTNYNARKLGATNMKFMPDWAFGWYFIPIANLWKPYQAVKEIWKASINPKDWEKQQVPDLLGLWWFCWIASILFGSVIGPLEIFADTINKKFIASAMLVLLNVLSIIYSFILLSMINQIYQLQMSHFKKSRFNIRNFQKRRNTSEDGE